MRDPRLANGGVFALALVFGIVYTSIGILIGRLIWG